MSGRPTGSASGGSMTRNPRRTRLVAGLAGMAMVASLVAVATTTASPATAANTTDDLQVQVVSGRDAGTYAGAIQAGDKVEDWSYLLQRIEAGDPHQSAYYCLPPSNNGTKVTNPDGTSTTTYDPNYPNNCRWPGTRESNTGDPIISSGTQDGVSVASVTGGKPIKVTNLPEGDYIVSIKANGYEIGGAQFHSPMSGPVTVKLNPGPLPLATVRIRVFEDMAPVDGTYEIDAEPGLSGFRAYLADMLGDVSTDFYGNPLCTRYVHNNDGSMALDSTGSPTIASNNPGTGCLSNGTGDIEIPNMAPGRYGITVRPPSGKTNWYQTTTLEGATDHDWWVMAGDTGWGTETTYGGEPVPEVQFGFVPPRTTSDALPSAGGVTPSALGAASITGSVHYGCHYIGSPGGMVANAVPGVAGPETKDCGPIANGVVAVSALDLGDQVVATTETSATGAFTVPNLADGNYMLAFFDKTMTTILEVNNVTITNGQSENVGTAFLSPWFAKISGYVFVDDNGNGKRDPGEPGVQSSTLTVRERDNTPMDQFTNIIDTDVNGHYTIDQAYPLARYLILEHVNSRYRPTGFTVKSCNDTESHTYTGAAVDISVLPVLGLCAEVDWAVFPIPSNETDGIAGTVSYGTTRNELDPADGVTEDWQPGISGVDVHLYAAVICGTDLAKLPEYKDQGTCSADGKPMLKADGSAVRTVELTAPYPTESYHRPKGCSALDRNGNPLTEQKALPAFGDENLECVESNMLGTQAKPQLGTESTPDNPFPGDNGQEVNGNYGFGTTRYNLYLPTDPNNPGDPATGEPLPLMAKFSDYGMAEQPLPPGDYIVSIDIPQDAYGDPMYKVTKEEDVNIFSGDEFAPQENFPLGSATEAGDPQPGTPLPIDSGAGVTSSCVGPNHLVDVPNADNLTRDDFVAGGGSPFQGQQRPLCTDKLVELQGGSTGATNFELFTDVPLATHFWGLLINDIGLQTDPKSIGFDEAEGIPNVPTGIYDWAGNLVTTADSDRNGFYEAVVPSSDRINNPSPTGVSPNMYRFVGNDPGQPGHLNKNYNPRYRTIATNFQAWPGLWTVTDTAPTSAATGTFTNGSWVQTVCDVTTGEPELFAVSNPVADVKSGYADVTLTGQGFGADSAGVHQVLLSGPDGSATDTTTWTPLEVRAWTSTSITVRIPQASDSFLPGARSLAIMNNSGQRSTQGITLQVLGTGGGSTYDPQQFHVGPGQTYGTIQDALDAALAAGATASSLVVVHPGNATTTAPRGEYAENPVIGNGVRLQGYGPGGFQGGTWTDGSIITGEAFAEGSQTGTNWNATILATPHAASTIDVPDAATITVLSPPSGTGTAKPAIDGFRITGGHEQNVPTNISVLTNTQNTPFGAPGAAITQGGGIYVHGGSDGLTISNNVIEGNSGAYAGGIRVGTPYANGSISATTAIGSYPVHNTNLSISHNRVLHNGGANLAGGIGIFSGTEGYTISGNDVCGNFSAEYGGGISQYGLSKQGRIDHNRLWYNQSYDHGGGILLGGELMQNPSALSLGTGDVTVSDNRITQNTANDDGGGIDLLNVANWRVLIQNDEIVNNVSTHEGGGIGVTDASNVVIVNSTIARNITTATANTSNGQPAPAGVAIAALSAQLRATLTGNPAFRAPLMFNDILWDNRAGTYDGITVTGIGNGDSKPVTTWDVGSIDGNGPFAVTSSVITPVPVAPSPDVNKNQITASATNSLANPLFVKAVLPGIQIDARRAFGVFRQATMLDQTQSPWNPTLADYRVGSGSSARGRGAACSTVACGSGSTPAPALDIDSYGRTNPNTAGSWEYRDSGFAKPTAPTNLAVTPNNASLVLTWAPPANTGGLAITKYTVTASGGAAVPAGCGVVPSTSCTFTGLTNNTAYTFTITASNALGDSPAASVSGTPGVGVGISGVTLTATDSTRLRVGWAGTVPAGRTYVATAYASPTSTQSLATCQATTGSQCTINLNLGFGNSLRNTPVFVSVASRATTPANSPFTAPTPRIALPTSPRSVVAHRVEVLPATNPRTVNVNIGWAAPSSLGTGATITGYTVRVFNSPSSGTVAGTCPVTTTLSCTLTLPRGTSTNGNAYAVEITATTSVGSSWPSQRITSDTDTIPGAPTGVVAANGSGSTLVSWTAPADQLNGPVTGYQIRVSVNGGAFGTPTTLASAATSTTVTGLVNGRRYVFQVRARNALTSTYGDWSAPSRSITLGTPPVPTGVTVVGGNSTQDMFTGGTLAVTWSQPTNTTAAVTSWRVRVYASATSTTVLGQCTYTAPAAPALPTRTCTVTGLARATHYWAGVSARNSVGRSNESSPRTPGVTT